MAKVDDNYFPKIIADMQTTDPAAPTDRSWKLYSKANGVFARSSNTIVGPLAAASGAAAGALVFLEAHTASSSATLDFTSFISSTYDDYVIEIVGILPATDAVNLQMEVGTGGGPTYDTTGSHYSSVIAGFKNDGSAYGPVVQNSGIPELAHKVSSTTDFGGVQITMRFQLPQSTTQRRNFTGYGQYVTNDGGLAVANLSLVAAQYVTLGTALTALRFLFTSGNIASGTIRIYGISKS